MRDNQTDKTIFRQLGLNDTVDRKIHHEVQIGQKLVGVAVALFLLALGTSVTVIQRIYHAYKVTKESPTSTDQ